ncbi:Asx homology domain-containing protein [Aspergillus aurantiobrunneus]
MDSTKPKPKRTPRRAAKDRYEEEKLMTSDKSRLIDLDLVRLLALPEAWNCLEEAEKKEILDLLPSDTHPDPEPSPDDPDAKIAPLADSFLRYSNHWRDAIRHFQLDLQNGRCDPQWIREAEEAIQQRAAGKFDKFKEQEFEEFWGQKQKMDRNLAAGESSRVKLSTLIEHGVIRKGDIWKWSRSFSLQKTLVEKEARITEINGGRLTFVVPAGQRVFLKVAATPNAKDSATGENPESAPTAALLSPSNSTTVKKTKTDSDVKDLEAASSRKRSAEPEIPVKATKRARGRSRKQETTPVEEKASNLSVEITNSKTLSHTKDDFESPEEVPNGDFQSVEEASNDIKPVDEQSSQLAPEANEEPDEVVIPDIQGPTALTLKILEVDGRIQNATNGNAWKELRCFRNNQDMGTLWEVRHAWYVKSK